MSRKPKEDNVSPLGRWLIDKGVKQRVFCGMLEQQRGARVRQSSVSEWASGAVEPSDAVIVAIERATQGEVPRTVWPCWQRRNPNGLPVRSPHAESVPTPAPR